MFRSCRNKVCPFNQFLGDLYTIEFLQFLLDFLKITTKSNILQADFLDITLNLTTRKYWPNRKPSDIPFYINANSNYLPSIKKQLTKMISSRLSKNSYSLQEFNKTIPEYQSVLKKSGYMEKLTNVEQELKKTDQFNSTSKNRSRNRTRKIILFNPLSMKKSALTLVKNFLLFSISIFHPATNTTKFSRKTT